MLVAGERASITGALMVDNHYLDSLRQPCPKQPHYFTRENRKDSLLVKD